MIGLTRFSKNTILFKLRPFYTICSSMVQVYSHMGKYRPKPQLLSFLWKTEKSRQRLTVKWWSLSDFCGKWEGIFPKRILKWHLLTSKNIYISRKLLMWDDNLRYALSMEKLYLNLCRGFCGISKKNTLLTLLTPYLIIKKKPKISLKKKKKWCRNSKSRRKLMKTRKLKNQTIRNS